jgi:NAD(P)-dependent dehydrogenase (short-subunit alcohol dehydrogenase family)
MQKNKAEKIALITGSSRGIGAATASLFASHGYAVCINYRSNQTAADQIANKIVNQGGRCVSCQADASLEKDVDRLFAFVDNELGPLDCLVNNVGILQKQSRLENMTAERINETLTKNVTSYFICSREAIKRMSTRHGGNGGTIINVSSGASKRGAANEFIDYASSKGAIDSLTIGLAREVVDEGIRVNAVRPGLIDTEMHIDSGEPGRVNRLKENIPMKRPGQPEEVAEAIWWLASGKSSFMTGSFLDLTGGL